MNNPPPIFEGVSSRSLEIEVFVNKRFGRQNCEQLARTTGSFDKSCETHPRPMIVSVFRPSSVQHAMGQRDVARRLTSVAWFKKILI